MIVADRSHRNRDRDPRSPGGDAVHGLRSQILVERLRNWFAMRLSVGLRRMRDFDWPMGRTAAAVLDPGAAVDYCDRSRPYAYPDGVLLIGLVRRIQDVIDERNRVVDHNPVLALATHPPLRVAIKRAGVG